MPAFMPLSGQVVFDAQPPFFNSAPLVGAIVSVFDAGTNTPRTAYRDGLATTPWAVADLKTDASGRIPSIWVVGGNIKVRVVAIDGRVILDIDQLPGEPGAVGSSGGSGAATELFPGALTGSVVDGIIPGWVRANGLTIGNAGSGATERPHADTEPLFVALWPNTLFAVSGGRGATPAADFAAGKQLSLPNLNGATLVAVDGMGSLATGKLTGVTFATGNSSTIGSSGGAASVALTVAQLAAHPHTGTALNNGGHSHTGTTSSAGSHGHTATTDTTHTHTGSTSSIADHSHNYDLLSIITGFFQGGGTPFPAPSGPTTTATSLAGGHLHTFTTAVAGLVANVVTVLTGGLHTHSFATSTAGVHPHVLSVESAGSGEAHPNMQPFVTAYYYIKL
jgi:hypothetical protein